MHIAVREHESLPVVQQRAHAAQRVITDHERDQLLALNDSFPRRVVEFHHRSVRFRQYCGAIQLGALTLEILPKIAEADGEGGLELFTNQNSAVLTSTTWADGLIDLPAGETIARGQMVRYLPFAELLG